MKITHCIFSMLTGGAQVLVVDLLNCFSFNHKVSLVIVNNEWDESILARLNDNIFVYYINRPKGSRSPFYIFKLNFILWKLSPDIVHCHETNMASLFIYKNFKTILTIHDVGKRINNINSYDSIIAISSAVAVDFEKRYNVQLRVVNNGVNVASYLRRSNYLIGKNESFKIVQISRLIHEKKGQDLLIRSIEQIITKYKFRKIELFIIGEGDSKRYLTDLVLELGIQSHVYFLGNKNRDWILNNLCTFNLLVQPSLYEGFGLTIIEGFAAGVPVVASNIDGPLEILNILDYDFKFEVNNYSMCSEKIIDIIRLYDLEQVQNIMQDSIIKISNKYCITKAAEGYLNSYLHINSSTSTL